MGLRTFRITSTWPFRSFRLGLIQGSVNPATKSPAVNSWKAEPWMAGGMAAIMLHDPNDRRDGTAGEDDARWPGSGSRERNRGGPRSRCDQEARRFSRCGISRGSKARLLHRKRTHRQPGHADSGPSRFAWILARRSRDALVIFCGRRRDRAPSRFGFGGYAADCAHRGGNPACSRCPRPRRRRCTSSRKGSSQFI